MFLVLFFVLFSCGCLVVEKRSLRFLLQDVC